jgi:Raf kinase inhibitor-like YbhB/YbcL family protein
MINIEATRAVDYKQLKISSPAFGSEEMIPVDYTCDGKNINPPLDIQQIPDEAKSLVVIVEDHDAPIDIWVHWLVWNIPVTHHIRENETRGKQGINDFQLRQYAGPCPPLSGVHRYFFKVYALRTVLDLSFKTKKLKLEKAMSDYIVAYGELVGLYKRSN